MDIQFEILKTMAEDSEVEKIQKLRKLTTPITKRIMRKYRTTYQRFMEDQDIEQICLLELSGCIERFNPEVSTDFLGYYRVCAENAVLGNLRKMRQLNNKANYESISLDSEIADCENISGIDMLKNNILDYEPEYNIKKLHYENIYKIVIKQITSLEKQIFEDYLKGDSYVALSKKYLVSVKKVDNTIQKIRKIYRPLI